MRVKIRLAALAAAASILLCCLTGCAAAPVSRSGFYLDTSITITIYDCRKAERALDNAFALCEKYDRMFARDLSGSDVWRINHAHGEPVAVSQDTAGIIALGIEYGELSGGRFDITCGRVTELWDFHSAEPTLPDADALAEAVSSVGYGQIALDGQSVSVPDGVKLDLGGIAKGYIADRIAEQLRANGVTGAMIDLGGNIVAVGDKNGQPFRVGVQSPYEPDNYIDILSVRDLSIVTAGSYERCFELDGKLYHHILDLSDGMPSDTGLASVTVLSGESVTGDALSTTCFLLGPEEGRALIDSIDGVEAIFALTDGTIVKTDGVDDLCG